ncbi:MAG TPA: DUF309 domain-containing protein [Thermoanaerobaculia bacterium]|nr:DUF309 domain-containing protein [Thermoanaerobaculia bacterium]
MLRATDDIRDDPRFLQGIEFFNAGEFLEAGDCLEDLFFEAVGWEVGYVRLFLQISVGMLHAERHQWRAAGERLREGLIALDRLSEGRELDLPVLRGDIVAAIEATRLETVPAMLIVSAKT